MNSASASHRTLAFGIILFVAFAFSAQAQVTNSRPDAEIQAQALVQRILSEWPAGNSTNTGKLRVTDGNGERSSYPVVFTVLASSDSWQNHCESKNVGEHFVIIHKKDLPTEYYSQLEAAGELKPLTRSQIYAPFSRSDFWLCDLGLEFFHWPGQKIIKKEFYHNCACMVLESTNPNPPANGYSRVVSWIDEDSLGIVEAIAYDASGQKLKKFYPKSLQKVKGQYQVKSMDMENVQTGSLSRLEFDLDN